MLKHGHIWVAWIWFRRIIYLLLHSFLPHLHTEQEPMSTVGCSGFYTGHIQLPADVFLDVKVMLVMVFSNSNVFVGGCRRLARLALNLNSVPYSPYSVRSVWSLSIAVALRPIRRRRLYTVPFCTLCGLLWLRQSYSRTTHIIHRTFLQRLLSDYESCILDCHGFFPWFFCQHICFSLGTAFLWRAADKTSRHAHRCQIRSFTLRSKSPLATLRRPLTW